jgi:MFS superfamily sulfate permease-like transporter
MKSGALCELNKEETIVSISRQTRSFSLMSALKADFLPSIAVFLVALPLCMGIAIASGVPVAAGLITGIVGGIVVGMLAGAPFQVSGPAAGLTVIIYDIVDQYGFESLGIVVLMAGAIQILAGIFKLGQWFRAVSPAVIKGMLAGIGVLIFASQFHVMVDDQPKKTGIENLLTIPQAIAKGLPLPEATTAEQRDHRTALLKQVGGLHEKQTVLLDSVADLVPKNPADDVPISSDESARLIAAQKQITTELRGVLSEINKDSFAEPNGKKAGRTAELALTHSEAALAGLEKNDLATLNEEQQAAAESLHGLLVNLKSHQWAAKVGLLTIVVLLLWQAYGAKRFRAIPAPLVAVVIATVVAAVWSLPVLYVEVPDSLISAVHLPSVTIFSNHSFTGLLGAAVVVALIASAETLLCATAVDQMKTGSRTDYDRELWAQGVGNSVCGILGALPMTGVIVRSAANIQAGAQTRVSAILHGVWLLVFVGLLGFVLRSIPIACLAAVLVYIGYKLFNLKELRALSKYGWEEVCIYMATLIGIVTTDLLTGVIIGMVLSAARLLYKFSHMQTSLDVDPDTNRTVLSIEGTATFLRLPLLAATLDEVPPDAELHVDLQHLDYIDHACLDLLMNWAKQHESVGGSLVIDWDSLHANFRGDSRGSRRAGSRRSANAINGSNGEHSEGDSKESRLRLPA